jgi:hypothetical protein
MASIETSWPSLPCVPFRSIPARPVRVDWVPDGEGARGRDISFPAALREGHFRGSPKWASDAAGGSPAGRGESTHPPPLPKGAGPGKR